ncbi:MAG: membrane protein insertion efficiency factor YidD [Mucispirillum sp.]|nr:membrane protein insertion efficiency factor YidD [Mucispirillum sp.]
MKFFRFLKLLHPKNIAVMLIKFYKCCISPYLGNHCRFYPSCSSYAIEAFQKKGFIKGFILTVWRILRCNPFCKGGYDPVK